MAILVSGACDIGRKRKSNQDSIFLSKKHGFFAVADGMGGHNGGDIASQTTVEQLRIHLDQGADNPQPAEMLKSIVKKVNKYIYSLSIQKPQLRGMGTTLNGVYYTKDKIYITNIGDSRTYLVNKGALYQLSRDHSLIQEKLDLGFYTREEARLDKMKNVLVRTLGFEEEVEVDVFSYKPKKYDLFLTCSDGLHGKIHDKELLEIINKLIPTPGVASQKDLDLLVAQLIKTANLNGGDDNISVIVSIAQ